MKPPMVLKWLLGNVTLIENRKKNHRFDEYTICVSGEYTACFEDKEIILCPGDELFFPKGSAQWGRCKAGTRIISALGGKRIK